MSVAAATLLAIVVVAAGCRRQPAQSAEEKPIVNEYFGDAWRAGASIARILRDLGQPPLVNARRPFVRVMYVPSMTRHEFVVRIHADDRGGTAVESVEGQGCHICAGTNDSDERTTVIVSRNTASATGDARKDVFRCLESNGFWTSMQHKSEHVMADGEMWIVEVGDGERYAVVNSARHDVASGLKECFVNVLRVGFATRDIKDVLRFPMTRAEVARIGGQLDAGAHVVPVEIELCRRLLPAARIPEKGDCRNRGDGADGGTGP